MRRILLITEDERDLAHVHGALVREGYRLSISAPDDDSLVDAVGEFAPEVLVVDCRRDGAAAANARRFLGVECNFKELLVLAIIAKEQAGDMEWAGIDEFLLEPFDEQELLARLRLVFWRTRKIASDQVILIDSLAIDTMNYEVSVDGMPIELTYKEYELLKFLATHRGRVFTRESLLNHVWGYDYYGGVRTVDVHIRRLRSKLLPPTDTLIETVRQVGYRFRA